MSFEPPINYIEDNPLDSKSQVVKKVIKENCNSWELKIKNEKTSLWECRKLIPCENCKISNPNR